MLPRSHRIPSSEIPRMMRHGKRVSGESVQLIVQKSEGDVSRFTPRHKKLNALGTSLGRPRFAFIVSTNIDKRATQRNRIRRMLSESVRHLIPQIAGSFGCICIAKRGLAGLDQKQVEKIVLDAFMRARIIP